MLIEVIWVERNVGLELRLMKGKADDVLKEFQNFGTLI